VQHDKDTVKDLGFAGFPVYLTLAKNAEVAGSEHADDFVILVFAIDRIQYPRCRQAKSFLVSASSGLSARKRPISA
jgi:hypothetical protein